MRLSYLYDLPLPSVNKSAPIQIVHTCRELAALGVPATVFGRTVAADRRECLAYYGLEPHPEFALRPFFSRWDWRLRPSSAMARLLDEHPGPEPQIVMSRGTTALRVSSALPRQRRSDVLFVYEAHRLCFAHRYERQSGQRWSESTPLSPSLQRFYERERATVEGADAVVCLTEGVRETLTGLFGITCPTLVLPSGTSAPVGPSPSPGAPERDLDVVYIGKLMARKGLAPLFAAMRHLPGRKLCLVGGTREEIAACRAWIGDESVASRVEFAGFVPPERVPEYLARARVGVCPLSPDVSVISQRFTSPLKLLEMMAHGVPVVASDLQVTRAIVTDRESALLVPPDDPVALADGIRTLLDDHELAARLAQAARERVLDFTWQKRASRLREFLDTLTAEPRPDAVVGAAGVAGAR